MEKTRLVIIGAGNGAHCYSGLASTLPDLHVRLLIMYKNRAKLFRDQIEQHPLEITYNEWSPGKSKTFTSRPAVITDKPEDVIPDADLVVFMLPVFAFEVYFRAIVPLLKDDAVIVGAPGGSGFEFMVRHYLGSRYNNYTVISLESLPWPCRINQFTHSAIIFAEKATLHAGSNQKRLALIKPKNMLEYTMLGRINIVVEGPLIGMSLLYHPVHPVLMYQYWKNWDGEALTHAPLFYTGTRAEDADMINKVSDEILSIRDAILKRRPEINIAHVRGFYEYLCSSYSDDMITDKTSLLSTLHTNKGYQGLTYPMLKTEDENFLPDFGSRYLVEDIPMGLVGMRGIADVVGVKTPLLDTLIKWAQEKNTSSRGYW